MNTEESASAEGDESEGSCCRVGDDIQLDIPVQDISAESAQIPQFPELSQEVDFLRSEKEALLTNIGCLEKQVRIFVQ